MGASGLDQVAVGEAAWARILRENHRDHADQGSPEPFVELHPDDLRDALFGLR